MGFDNNVSLVSCKDINEMKRVVDNNEDKAIIEELDRLSMDEKFFLIMIMKK